MQGDVRLAKSRVAKRSIVIGGNLGKSSYGHKTSISLEDDFWNELKGIAKRKGLAVSALVSSFDDARRVNNLSSVLRVAVLKDVLERTVRPRTDSDSGDDARNVDSDSIPLVPGMLPVEEPRYTS